MKPEAFDPPDGAQAVLKHIGQPKGQQQTVQGVTPVQTAYHQPLHDQPQYGRQQGSQNQGAPEAYIGRQLVGNISAQGQEPAVGEVDDAGQIDNQGKAQGHEYVKGTHDQAKIGRAHV